MERPKTILVIEDARDIRTILTLLFEEAGYQVIGAEDGESALQTAAVQDLALATLDLSLPDLDGLEVLRRLRASPATQDLPVVIITAYTSRVPPADRARVQAVVSKPFDLDELVELVHRIAGPP